MSQIIIDVREPEEYAAGNVAGAINIPIEQLLGDLQELAGIPKNTELILYCQTGSRSAVAKNILTRQDFTNIINGINKKQVEASLLRETPNVA